MERFQFHCGSLNTRFSHASYSIPACKRLVSLSHQKMSFEWINHRLKYEFIVAYNFTSTWHSYWDQKYLRPRKCSSTSFYFLFWEMDSSHAFSSSCKGSWILCFCICYFFTKMKRSFSFSVRVFHSDGGPGMLVIPLKSHYRMNLVAWACEIRYIDAKAGGLQIKIPVRQFKKT